MAEHLIHILPERVASQIAAGEVVERPASAVKELIENSLDAGASAIMVEIAAGGTALLAVSDDGCGMSAHDAVLALRRHATSKIREVADLVAVHTMGFRGEALAAIASVSRLELKTRRPEDLAGTQIRVEGGEEGGRQECAMAPGTRIEARDLFFNTPARLKFLRTPATEQGAVVEVVQRLALAAPRIAFELIADGRRVLELARATSALERWRQLFGAKSALTMMPVSGDGAGIALEGLISHSQQSFASARLLYTYVNGRAVRDRMLLRAIGNAYATLVPKGRYPAAALFLTVRPQEVDVNVHPMKAEVRFRNAGALFETVYGILRQRLLGAGGGADPGPAAASAANLSSQAQTPSGGDALDWPPAESAVLAPLADAPARPLRLVALSNPAPAAWQPALGLGYRASAAAPCEAPVEAARLIAAGQVGALPAYSELRVLGQLFCGYIALEDHDGLVLVDQHAAHERVTFERLKAQMEHGGVEVQNQLIPQTLELNPARAAHLGDALPRLRALGFELEPFGPATLLLKGSPAVFGAEGGVELLREMIEVLGEPEAQAPSGLEHLLKQLACHGSVRVGRVLKGAEIGALLADLDRTPFKSNCPHGRPTHIRFSRGQIERMFRR
ncbi:MAG TPA: DNA mismatch repair endonuclease MutL [Candidatus Binataceae bacterium]|nr:DNA mismatch repair endonuclease MutL [Candidatus Binataceae bacterium]